MSVMIPEYGGCLWPVDPACLTDEWESLDLEIRARSLALASSTLERLVGYRVGECPITIRPCVQRGCWSAFIPFQSYNDFISPGMNRSGQWVNGCGCQGACATTCEVELPSPVGRVDEVMVNGTALDEMDYRIDNGNILVWVGAGECPWPTQQDLKASLTDDNTFGVTYLNAYPVDSLGAYAVGILAMEFAKACTGSACRLPRGVTQIARQGVTMTISTGAFPDGLTSIREVDSYIGLWNPNGLRQEPKVWTPGMNQPRITTWSAP